MAIVTLHLAKLGPVEWRFDGQPGYFALLNAIEAGELGGARVARLYPGKHGAPTPGHILTCVLDDDKAVAQGLCASHYDAWHRQRPSANHVRELVATAKRAEQPWWRSNGSCAKCGHSTTWHIPDRLGCRRCKPDRQNHLFKLLEVAA